MPAVPRRTAPPRPKKKVQKLFDEPLKEEGTGIPLPESTPISLADAGGVKTEVPPDTDLKEEPNVLIIKSNVSEGNSKEQLDEEGDSTEVAPPLLADDTYKGSDEPQPEGML